MPPVVAASAFIVLIIVLIWADREPGVRTSPALWIPVIWLSLACSRSAGQWLHLSPPVDSADAIMEGSPVDRFFYAFLIFLGIAILVPRLHRVGRILQNNLPVLLFFAYCLTSLVWSDFPSVAFKRWFKAVGDFIMILIVWTDTQPIAAVRLLITRVAYILLPLSVVFIKYYPTWGRTYGRWGGEVHYTGVTTNKNTLGAICLLFGLLLVWHFAAVYRNRELRGRKRILAAKSVVLAIMLWLFWMANSMTSLSCFVIGAMVLFLTDWKAIKRRPGVAHIVILGVLGFTIAVLFFGAGSLLLQFIGRNPTLTGRTEIWSVVLSVAASPWVGTGYDSFWLGPRLDLLWNSDVQHITESHNGFLEVFLNLGWIGVALLLVVLVTGYLKLFRAYRQNAPMGNLMLTYCVIGIAYNFTEASFFRMMTPIWFGILLAMTGYSELIRQKQKEIQLVESQSSLSSVEEPEVTARALSISQEIC